MQPSTKQPTKSLGRIEEAFQMWMEKNAPHLIEYFMIGTDTELQVDGLRILFVKKLLR